TVESRMLLHMLVEFPALLAAGWAAHRTCLRAGALRRLTDCWGFVDGSGWICATLLSTVALLWMVPTMLDLALLSTEVAAGKYAAWWLAGWAIAGSWRSLDPAL